MVHTFVFEELRHVKLTEGRASNITTIDLMGPLVDVTVKPIEETAAEVITLLGKVSRED